jgi:magnesium transporter
MTEAEQQLAAEPAERGASEERAAAVTAALAAGKPEDARALVADMPAPDLADLIELLEGEQRVALIQALGAGFDYEVLSELDERVRDQLSEALPNELLARAVGELETDDAAYVIESLQPSDQAEILAQMPTSARAALERVLEYPEDSAGRIMSSDFVAVAPFWTVGQVIDYMRETDDLPDTFSDIFVVDPAYKVLGSVDLSRLLRTKRTVRVDEIMDGERHVVAATAERGEVANQFTRYDLKSAPVIDEHERLVGVVTVDDVVEVIQEEANEDMLALAGVGDERLADSVLRTLQSRLPWLIVNLGTAVIASLVIKLFDATIEQMVSLAVLMPIVASMGGNAGTQTMAVTVRALATERLGAGNAPRVITRETLVGLANGLVMSCIMAAVVFVWFGSGKLGLVIGAAMIVNLLVAALAGILVPLALHRYDLDPAPAAGVFVTMMTDVCGFFAFLGLASLWLM